MSESPRKAPENVRQIYFDDNKLLVSLFGEYDKNLAWIEKELSIKLLSRGNRVAVTGRADAVAVACRTLNRLYRCLQRGENVGMAEVEAVAWLVTQNFKKVLKVPLLKHGVDELHRVPLFKHTTSMQ